MTRKELLALPHLAIAALETINEKQRLHIHTEEGYKITKYKKDDDIKFYSSFVCMFSPILEEYPDYRVITLAEDAEYQENKEKEINKLKNE